MRTARILAAAAFAACALAPFSALAANTGLQSDLIIGGDPANTQIAPENVTEKEFMVTAEKYLLGIVAMVAVAVFVWIGYNMLTAEGDPEKFKQAQKALTYAVVGLALIPLAYVMVRLILTVNL